MSIFVVSNNEEQQRQELIRELFVDIESVYNKFINKIDTLKYLGEDVIEVLKIAFDKLISSIKMLNKTASFSLRYAVTPIQVIHDRFDLFGDVEALYERFNRLCTDEKYSAVKKAFDVLMSSINNVLKGPVESITGIDVTRS